MELKGFQVDNWQELWCGRLGNSGQVELLAFARDNFYVTSYITSSWPFFIFSKDYFLWYINLEEILDCLLFIVLAENKKRDVDESTVATNIGHKLR